VPPFGFFRKKVRTDDLSIEDSVISAPPAGALSIQEAQALLQQIESANVQSLAARLSPIKESAAQSLKTIEQLANEMEHEKIKLEGLEQRHKSVVENSRKTIVTSLRREASVALDLPQSVNDAKKFKEKFEAMMNRFGEVSGSHRKVLNTFMKKNANRMKDEFERLQRLLSDAKSVISEFDQKRIPLVKCGNFLNTAAQKASTIKSGENYLRDAETQISQIEEELATTNAEFAALKNSPEFDRAAAVAERRSKVKDQQQVLHNQIHELFSHVSRAFTKYSYGLTKETEARLNLMSSEPWRILDESDTSPYSSLLFEVRKSVQSGKIQLKDSDKTIHYFDIILQSLPDFQEKAKSLKSDLESLAREDSTLVSKTSELEERILQRNEEIIKNRHDEELQRRQNEERKQEVALLLREAEALMFDLANQRYSLHY